MELFSEQEKQYIKSEFTYNKTGKRNPNLDSQGVLAPLSPTGLTDGGTTLDKDCFTEHALDSVNNSILKNSETKSVILAPFNSTKSDLGQHSLPDSIRDLIEDRKIIKFGPRVRDIDRQYEINNNADLDNGVYHHVEEEKKEETHNDSCSEVNLD